MRIRFLIIAAFIASVQSTYAQDFQISPPFGLSYRTDSYMFPTLLKTQKYFLYTPFLGGGFLGVNPGITLRYSEVGLEYHPNFRYGKVTDHWVLGSDKHFHQEYERAWLVDHEFGLFFKPENLRFGIGYSIFNDNARYDYESQGQEMVQNVEYDAISVYTSIPIKHWFEAEFKFYYIRDGDPNDPRYETWLFGLRVFKEFDLIIRKK